MNLLSLETPTSLPDWMVIFAFLASLGLTILVLIEGICRRIRKATLEVVLTREVFYRLLDTGECLYANAVLVAYDSGALVQDIEALLTKRDGATKNFNLRIAQIGEKYRAPDGTYQFSFHSTSPLSFVPVNIPHRMVYICEQASYADATRTSFFEFSRRLSEIKVQYEAIEAPDDNTIVQLRADVATLVDNSCSQIMDQMQIEPGKYELTVEVKYRQKGKMLPVFKRKSASSSVRFSVGHSAREYFRYMLRQYLDQRVRNVLFNQTDPTPAPEYTPQDIKEMAG
ncbi:MAG TPA: hypothetical protein VNA25_17725 [Phycisphaerae bacterium]|nr:hypothetical protein [Phycisphaerae bacterium]